MWSSATSPPSPTSDFSVNVNKILFLYENVWNLDFRPLPHGPGPVPKNILSWLRSLGHKLSVESYTSKIGQPPRLQRRHAIHLTPYYRIMRTIALFKNWKKFATMHLHKKIPKISRSYNWTHTKFEKSFN